MAGFDKSVVVEWRLTIRRLAASGDEEMAPELWGDNVTLCDVPKDGMSEEIHKAAARLIATQIQETIEQKIRL